MKVCSCGSWVVERNGNCASCNHAERKSEREQIKSENKIKKVSFGIKLHKNKIANKSVKRAKETLIYNKAVIEFLKDKRCAVFPQNRATECHHTKGRSGKNYLDQEFWLAVSTEGHQYIHAHPEWSFENGYMLKRSV